MTSVTVVPEGSASLNLSPPGTLRVDFFTSHFVPGLLSFSGNDSGPESVPPETSSTNPNRLLRIGDHHVVGVVVGDHIGERSVR